MKMLLKISAMPTEYELQVNHARLEYGKSSPPVVQMTRERGGFQMDSQRATLRLDTYEARSSLSPTVKRSISQYASKGVEMAQSYSAQTASETKQMRWSKMGEGGDMLNQIFTQRAQVPTGDFQLSFLPSVGPEIMYQPGNLETEYQMDRLSFEFKMQNREMEYVPGSVDIVVTKPASLDIEYIGDPIYVPPSSGERYLGKQLDVVA